jgi:hypothetical protein
MKFAPNPLPIQFVAWGLRVGYAHGCMARGGHGLPKVSLAPAMPYRSVTFMRPIL